MASELKLVEKKELLKSFYKLLDQGKVPSKAQVTSRAKVNVIFKDVNIELALEYLKRKISTDLSAEDKTANWIMTNQKKIDKV